MKPVFLRAPAARVISGVAVSLAAMGLVGVVVVDRPAPKHVVNAGGPKVRAEPESDLREVVPTSSTLEPTSTTTAPAGHTPPTTAAPSKAPPTSAAPPMTTHPPTSLQSGIYVVSANGGTPRRIVAGTGIHKLSFTPDGKRVTYMLGNHRIWTAPAEGGLSEPVGPEAAFMVEASWSPSGRYLAFGSTDNPSVAPQMTILDTTTGQVKNLGEFNWTDGALAWQSQSDILAYLRNGAIAIYNATTGQNVIKPLDPAAFAPLAWSQDGKQLAFSTQGDLAVVTFTNTSTYAFEPYRVIADSAGPKDAAWIGNQVFFIHPWQLDVAGAAGDDHRNLVNFYTGNLRVPAKNRTALFLSMGGAENSANRKIDRVNLDGSDRHTVVDRIPGHFIQDYAVSPDGSTIAFWAVGE